MSAIVNSRLVLMGIPTGSTPTINGFVSTGTGVFTSAATGGLELYNTADRTTNYERLVSRWGSNVALIGTETGPTNTTRALRLFSQTTNGAAAYAQAIFQVTQPFVRFGVFSSLSGTSSSSTNAAGVSFSFDAPTNTVTSGQVYGVAILPVYNQASGTAANTDLLISRTETAIGSGTQRLIDAQVGGVSRFSVGNAGNITSNSDIYLGTGANLGWTSRSFMTSPTDGNIRLTNAAGTDFSRLQFGGTTNAFPSLKRVSSGIQIRLADDSDFAPLAGSYLVGAGAAVNAGAGTVAYGGTTATTVGAAGAASALPANPLGYIIVNVAGTTAKIPYYNN